MIFFVWYIGASLWNLGEATLNPKLPKFFEESRKMWVQKGPWRSRISRIKSHLGTNYRWMPPTCWEFK